MTASYVCNSCGVKVENRDAGSVAREFDGVRITAYSVKTQNATLDVPDDLHLCVKCIAKGLVEGSPSKDDDEMPF